MSSFQDKINSLVQVYYCFHPNETRSPIELVSGSIANLQKEWLNNQILECNHCEFCGNKTIIRGDMNTAMALVISDIPGIEVYNQDEPCFPFEHTDFYENLSDRFEEEQILDYLMWCNVMNCHAYRTKKGEIFQSRPVSSSELDACKRFVLNLADFMIMTGQLKCILSMGSYALNVMINGMNPNDNSKNNSVLKRRGEALYYRGIPVFVTHDPVRATERKIEEINEDIGSFASFLRDDE